MAPASASADHFAGMAKRNSLLSILTERVLSYRLVAAYCQ